MDAGDLLGVWWHEKQLIRLEFIGQTRLNIARSLYDPNSPDTKNQFEVFCCVYKLGANIEIMALSHTVYNKDHELKRNTVMERNDDPFMPFWDSAVIFEVPVRLGIQLTDALIIDGQRFVHQNKELLIDYPIQSH